MKTLRIATLAVLAMTLPAAAQTGPNGGRMVCNDRVEIGPIQPMNVWGVLELQMPLRNLRDRALRATIVAPALPALTTVPAGVSVAPRWNSQTRIGTWTGSVADIPRDLLGRLTVQCNWG